MQVSINPGRYVSCSKCVLKGLNSSFLILQDYDGLPQVLVIVKIWYFSSSYVFRSKAQRIIPDGIYNNHELLIARRKKQS